jgi:O-antigen/teichoic acid export membrane protein
MLVALDTYNSMTIIAVRRQFLLPFINAAGLAANFAFNILLIPAFSYTGSAYALIASESVVAACMGALLFAEMRK